MILTSWIKADILTSFRKSYYLFLIYLDLLSISLCKNKTIFLLPNFWGSKSVWNAPNHQQVTQWSSGNFGARESIFLFFLLGSHLRLGQRKDDPAEGLLHLFVITLTSSSIAALYHSGKTILIQVISAS